MRIIAACAIAAAFATPSSSSGQQATQQAAPLAANYTIKVGDMAASALSEFLKLRTDFRDPALVTYEPETGTIDVEVFATPAYGSKTDQARNILGKYWEFIQGAHVPYVERRFKVKLGAPNYRLLYYDTKAEGGAKIILQFVNGQYLIP